MTEYYGVLEASIHDGVYNVFILCLHATRPDGRVPAGYPPGNPGGLIHWATVAWDDYFIEILEARDGKYSSRNTLEVWRSGMVSILEGILGNCGEHGLYVFLMDYNGILEARDGKYS